MPGQGRRSLTQQGTVSIQLIKAHAATRLTTAAARRPVRVPARLSCAQASHAAESAPGTGAQATSTAPSPGGSFRVDRAAGNGCLGSRDPVAGRVLRVPDGH